MLNKVREIEKITALTITALTSDIKNKKEYKKIYPELIEKLLARNKAFKKFIICGKGKDKEKAIKQVRALLRKIIIPMPQIFYRKFEYFKKNIDKKEILEKILAMHQSTKERDIKTYKWLGKIIKAEKIKKILDLGCGIDLIALWYYCRNCLKNKFYFGFDVDGYIIELVKEFVKKNQIKKQINVRVLHTDLSCMDWNKLKNKNQLVLALKILDALEEIERGLSEKIIELEGEKIISFSLKSLSGKRKIKEREWFERLLKKLKKGYKKIIKDGEIFYLIR